MENQTKQAGTDFSNIQEGSDAAVSGCTWEKESATRSGLCCIAWDEGDQPRPPPRLSSDPQISPSRVKFSTLLAQPFLLVVDHRLPSDHCS